MHPAPIALPENAGLAFVGEAAWVPAILALPEVGQLIGNVNACGRPNSDVLRRRLAVVNDQAVEGWQVDFPDHFTSQEAALYEQPYARLRQRAPASVWLNPHANPALRRALARVSRYMATPARAKALDWRWIEDDLLPDASLLVVARDDDFTHGVLLSQPFNMWFETHHRRLGPQQTVESFPFPWPPATPLNALTAAQEEQRHAIARAARRGNMEQLNSAVFAAYDWPAGADVLAQLTDLHRHRTG